MPRECLSNVALGQRFDCLRSSAFREAFGQFAVFSVLRVFRVFESF